LAFYFKKIVNMKNKNEPKDNLDIKIIVFLQKNAKATLDELAKSIGASRSTIWNRVRHLEESEIIRSYSAIINPEKIGLSMTFFTTIKTSNHDIDWLKKFSSAVNSIPEIVEVNRLSGEYDYLLKILAKNASHYDKIYKSLIKILPIDTINSSLSMESIKSDYSLKFLENKPNNYIEK